MKKLIVMMKVFWFFDTNGNNFLLPINMIIGIGISLIFCFDTTWMVLNYLNKGIIIGFRNSLLMIIPVINLSCIFISINPVITMWKGKVIGNMNTFLLQAPILKKDIYNSRFIIFQFESIPFLIIVIYSLGLSIFVSKSAYASAYSVFLILIYCIWAIAMSISIGFSSLSTKKYHAFRFLPIALMLTALAFMGYLSSIPYVEPNTLVSAQNMFSYLGPLFIPVLKACSHISEITGLIIIFATFLTSYFFSCKLPLKISEKEGA